MDALKNFQLDLCLVEPKGDINVGSVCRLSSNFEIHELHLVNPRNPFSNQVREFACAGETYLDNLKIFPSFKEVVSQDHHYVIGTTGKTGKGRGALELHELQQIAHVFASGTRVLLVFGRENTGLYQSELLHCDHTLSISLPGPRPILNLSHAVAVVLYEIQRIRGFQQALPAEVHKATSTDLMAFLQNLEDFLNSFGYYDKKERHYHRRVLEELIRRKDLDREETRFLQGIFRVHKNFLKYK